MTACNIVRFRVKAGMQKQFEDEHRAIEFRSMEGFRKGNLVKVGGNSYVFVGEWDSFDHLANARSTLIGILDRFRGLLEEIGGDLGVTYAVSGDVVVEV
jgi:hypothetical protein